MAVGKRKKIKRFVIDTNVWISYCINGELTWVSRYIIQNSLIIYASPKLLAEFRKVIQYPKIKRFLNVPVSAYISLITALVIIEKDIAVPTISPDPEDNYLFDLAISCNAKAIVCGDKLLLGWKETPVQLITMKEFENLF